MKLMFKSIVGDDYQVEESAPPNNESGLPAFQPVETDLSGEELSEYAAICERIGFASPALVNERLCHALHDEGIQRYNVRQVVAFLDKKLGEGKWHWRGLRDSDSKELGEGWMMHSGKRRVPFSDRTYTNAIPLPVLMTIEKIQKAVPEVHFYISTAGLPDEDPFLLVTGRGINSYIVERWDEPDFRER